MGTISDFDVVIVGGGVIGLAHAAEALKRGFRVAVFESDRVCAGASARNFGFVTISGQRPGETWDRARYSRARWLEVCNAAGIPIMHRGAWIACRSDEAVAVAIEYAGTAEGEMCRWYEPSQFHRLAAVAPDVQSLRLDAIKGLLHSPEEIRIHSRSALLKLASWLCASGASIHMGCRVIGLDGRSVHTQAGVFRAKRVILCVGATSQEFDGGQPGPEPIATCSLQMMRVEVTPNLRLPGSVLSDESLARYPGWSHLASCSALKALLARSCSETLAAGVHLIAVQDADGSLVLGDSHYYADHERFESMEVIDQMILDLARRVLAVDEIRVRERWLGFYPSAEGVDAIIRELQSGAVSVQVTSGTGASTAFGLARDTYDRYPVGVA